MNNYKKPLLEIIEIKTNDVILASGVEMVEDAFGFGDVSDEYL